MSKARRCGPEARVLVEIMATLGALPWCVPFRNNVGRADHFDEDTGELYRVAYGVGGTGAPDMLCEVETSPGSGLWLAVWLEVKSATGTRTPKQVRWHAAAQRRRRRVYTVRSAAEALAAVTAARAAAVGAARMAAGTGKGRAA